MMLCPALKMSCAVKTARGKVSCLVGKGQPQSIIIRGGGAIGREVNIDFIQRHGFENRLRPGDVCHDLPDVV